MAAFTAAQLNARRPLANFGNITQLTSNAWHDYRAMCVRLDKRFSNRYQYIVSYTREWTMDNVANVNDYYHPELNRGARRAQAHARRQRLGAAAVRL